MIAHRPPRHLHRLAATALLAGYWGCGGQESFAPLLPNPSFDAGVMADSGPTDVNDSNPPDAGIADSGPVDTGAAPDLGVEPDAGTPSDIRDRLLSVPGLQVTEVEATEPGTRAFLLVLEQPEDHFGPSQTFGQRLVLVHRAETAPMVVYTTGYSLFGDPTLWTHRFVEPTDILRGNQLTVEHRYFGESVPTNPNWEFLTIEQSANDTHRILGLLRGIYEGAWVGTGISKGGMTAIFHHHFFPDDYAAIVPYVAPISFGLEDSRYLSWLAQIGPVDGQCRQRVLDMTVEMVERRAEYADLLALNDPRAMMMDRALLEVVVTLPVFSFHWSFWQGLGTPEGCAQVPPRGGPLSRLTAWFPFQPEWLEAQPFDWDTGPYSYQVSNELGRQTISNQHLARVTRGIDYSIYRPAMSPPPPWVSNPAFNPNAMVAVSQNLQTTASRVLGIYGAWDPWSGGIITVDPANDSYVLVAPEVSHGAVIADLPPTEVQLALTKLNEWVGRRSLTTPDVSSVLQRLDMRRADHAFITEHTERIDRQVRLSRIGVE